MAGAWKQLSMLKVSFNKRDRELKRAFKLLTGSAPSNLNLYKLALTHSSSAVEVKEDFKGSNERLEYLGDAILSACIADFLFKRYPFKDEGFLTEIRSRLVSRESLNTLGRKMGVMQLVEVQGGLNNKQMYSSIFGNTLEAIVGAIYLDKGFKFTSKFIVTKLIIPNFDLDEIIQNSNNYKSTLIEWGQAKGINVTFEITNIEKFKSHKEFTAMAYLDGQPHKEGHGHNKKKAEQNAALNTLEEMKLI